MASNVTVIDGYTKGGGYIQIASLNAAVGIGTVPKDSVMALIQAEAQDIRWIDDGQTPTSTFGQILQAGATLKYAGKFSDLKFIETAVGGILNVSYYVKNTA